MFEVEKQTGRLQAMMCLVSLMISLLAHAAVLCVLVVLPLVFFSVIHEGELLTFLLPTPPARIQPPPPVPPSIRIRAVRHGTASMGMDLAPRHIPEGIMPPLNESPEPIGVDSVLRGMGGSAGPVNGIPGGIDTLVPNHPVILPPPPPPPRREPIRVGVLQQSKCILMVEPVYPRLAIITRVSGTVILEAIIDEEGIVSTVKALSGHPLLKEAAVQAVKQWKYSPTILNGEPVSIVAIVTVVFNLH